MTHHYLHHHDLTTISPSLQHLTSTSITTLSSNLATKSPKPLVITLTSPSSSTLLSYTSIALMTHPSYSLVTTLQPLATTPSLLGHYSSKLDKTVNEEMDDSLVRAATSASSLEAEHDSGNTNKTQSKATLNEPSSIGTSSGSGPKCQETIGDTIAQTRSENVSKLSNDPLLARGNTLQSGKDSLKLQELMELCTNLQQMVLDLEQTKTTQAEEIVGLSRRVKSSDEEVLGEKDASKQGRIADIDADAGINLVSTHFDADTDMFRVHDLVGDEVVAESEVVVKASEKRNVVAEIDAASTILVSAATITDVDITLAQALAELKSTKPKAKGIFFREPGESTTTTIPIPSIPISSKIQDKGKAKMIEPKPVKTLSKKDQLMLDEEFTFKLQAEKEEEERLAREKAQQIEEVNIA
ncbi:hypothetical protein Tco_0361235 [Tanacetum coccineum]